MLDNIPRVQSEKVKTAVWNGDPLEYDLQLYTLGEGEDEFWVLNPEFENSDARFFINFIPKTRKCVVFTYNGIWVAKLFKDGWYPYHGYESVEIIIPRLTWMRNHDIDSRMTFDYDPRTSYQLEFWDQDYELYWAVDPRFFPHDEERWVFKASVVGKKTTGTKFMGYLVPNVSVEYNGDLDFLNLDKNELLPPYYELDNECIFILDKTFTGGQTVEVAVITPSYKKPQGRKIVGVVQPEIITEINPKLEGINFELSNENVNLEDLKKENIWILPPEYTTKDEPDVWALKMRAVKKPKGQNIVGYAEPLLTVVTNPDLPELDFKIDYNIPWHDLKYEHLWMLNSKHTITLTEPMWAVKVSASDTPEGTKVVGDIEPKGTLTINSDVPVEFSLPKNFAIQYYNLAYEYVWVSEESGEKIWLAKVTYVDEPAGIKEIDVTDQLNEDQLDVIFISYNEPNAENNWSRVKEKAPWAQRIDGVKGILNAHKAAAKIARTDMFYVVDGDAHLVDTWKFTYRPSIFDRDCTYIWAANNPLTNLTYGHGGVKLFSKEKLLKLKKWRTLDMTTCVSEKIKVMSEISNVTEFNTDDFSSWKTAFRECVKLCLSVQTDHANENHKVRLDAWGNINSNKAYAQPAIEGARHAILFFKENEFDADALTKINDREWLEQQFKTTYKK